MGFLLDALLISVVWCICCIPVITIGAATAALHRVAINWMRRRAGCDIKTFLSAFWENLRGGTGVWLILLVPLALIVYNAYGIWIALVPATSAMKWMTAIAALVWTATAVYALPLQACFENPPMRTVLNALRISVCHIGPTLFMVVMLAAVLLFTLIFPYGAFAYLPAYAFLAARPAWNVFERVVGNPDVIVENGEEANANSE